MKLLLVTTAFLCGVISSAQTIQGSSGKGLIALEAGYTNFQTSGFNNFFSAQGYDGRFERLITYGIGATLPGGTAKGHSYDCQFGLHFYQQNKVGSPMDSTSYAVNGWELMTSIFGYDVLHNIKAVDLVLGPGIYWGGLKMEVKENAGGAQRICRNGFLAPMARADLRFNIWKISVGGRFSYRYDITNGKWKDQQTESNPLPGYRFREMQYLIYIGWIMHQE